MEAGQSTYVNSDMIAKLVAACGLSSTSFVRATHCRSQQSMASCHSLSLPSVRWTLDYEQHTAKVLDAKPLSTPHRQPSNEHWQWRRRSRLTVPPDLFSNFRNANDEAIDHYDHFKS
eukprot:6455475-Amphidinium_carterae.1